MSRPQFSALLRQAIADPRVTFTPGKSGGMYPDGTADCCPLTGAAFEAGYRGRGSYDDHGYGFYFEDARHYLGDDFFSLDVAHPVTINKWPVIDTIIDLFDKYCWTPEQIADWAESEGL